MVWLRMCKYIMYTGTYTYIHTICVTTHNNYHMIICVQEFSNECSSVSYPGDHSVTLPVTVLETNTSQHNKDHYGDVLLPRVSYSEVMEQKISSL